jgi:nicotinamide-nucleotide amidase
MIWVACALTSTPVPQYFLDGRKAPQFRRTPKVAAVRIEIVAVGTELLLGQIADTNSPGWASTWPPAGVASHFHQAVGDNHERITWPSAPPWPAATASSSAVASGPTQDDITREAIAEVMNVELVRDQAIVDVIAGFFEARGRTMTDNNARQADVPEGATIIPQVAKAPPPASSARSGTR